MRLVNELACLRGLAGDGDEALFVDPVFIEKIRDHGRQQQQQCQHGTLAHIVAACDNVVDLDGEGGVVAADGRGVGEVLQRLNEHQQRAGDDAGERQGEGDRPEGFPAACAHVAGGILHGGINGRQNAGEGQVGNREKAHHLHHDKAFHAVDAAVHDVEQILGDEPLLAEQENDGQGQHERGREDGQGRHRLEEALGGHIDAGDGVGKHIAHEGGDGRYDKTQCHGAAKDLAVAGCL